MKKENFICRVCGHNEYAHSIIFTKTTKESGLTVINGKYDIYTCSGCSTRFQDVEKFSLNPIKVKLGKDAIMPKKALEYDTGYDLYSPYSVNIPAHESIMLDTRVHIESQDKNIATQIRSRSGMTKKGIVVSNFGTIDQTYRGPCIVKLWNTTNRDFTIAQGDRVCQIVVEKVIELPLIEVDELNDTKRGMGRFGHTGK